MNIKEEIILLAPPEAVWDYVQDNTKRGEWDSSVVRVEKVTEGPLRAGSVIHIVTPPGGKMAFFWDGEYASYDRPRRSAVKMIRSTGFHPFSAMAGSWQYEAHGQDGTQTKFAMIMNYKLKWGIFGALLDALFIRRIIRATLKDSLRRLKERLS